ncbi:RNA 2',3'-cyclic phosphodiesterase [Methanolobus sp.]|uniref:RNA 2',3'-cyclic phosphodiesterase n=1 Tax=Methanolobus sp. TaxID=1874737 RepID=UPI00351F962B
MVLVRTFVAVDLPEEMHSKLAHVQSRFDGFKFKFVDPALVHITMKFLGEVSEDKINDISKALDEITYAPFEVSLHGLGVFPKPKFAKVIWLGCEGNFEELHKQIETSLSPFDFTADTHGFNAHVTLARVKYLPKKKKEDFLHLLEELKDLELGTMQVDAIRLKKSTLTPEGPVYETLHEVRLK